MGLPCSIPCNICCAEFSRCVHVMFFLHVSRSLPCFTCCPCCYRCCSCCCRGMRCVACGSGSGRGSGGGSGSDLSLQVHDKNLKCATQSQRTIGAKLATT